MGKKSRGKRERRLGVSDNTSGSESTKEPSNIEAPGTRDFLSKHWITPVIVGAAVAFDRIAVKIPAICLCALWLCFDLWSSFSSRPNTLRHRMVFGAKVLVILSGTVGISIFLINQRFNEEQRQVFNGLVATASTPSDVSAYDTDFTITNASDHAIGKHTFNCGIHLIVSNSGNNWKTDFATNTLSFDGKLSGGGDTQTYKCLSLFRSPRAYVDCLDIVMRLNYTLTDHPNTWRTKDFRVVAKQQDGFVWRGQPLDDPTEYCKPYLTSQGLQTLNANRQQQR
jgi:hypothetical protein